MENEIMAKFISPADVLRAITAEAILAKESPDAILEAASKSILIAAEGGNYRVEVRGAGSGMTTVAKTQAVRELKAVGYKAFFDWDMLIISWHADEKEGQS